jgi:sec-independent protein translocase protein TatA
MFKSFGLPEAAIILVVVLIVFGAGKLPQIGGALGKSIREFRKAKEGVETEMKAEVKEEAKDKAKSTASKDAAESDKKANQT